MQPPGSNGVQGLIYDKILPYLDACGWEFHFAGPSPSMASVLTEKVNCHPSRLHYSTNVSWSKRFSVLKNRCRNRSLMYLSYGFLQLISSRIERLLRHDHLSYTLAGLRRVVREAEGQWDYDLIAGKTPDFQVLEEVASLAEEMNKPLVALIDDPHGYRNELGFVPQDAEKQRRILRQCRGAVFMSPLTRDRYVQSDLVDSGKAYAMTDSYPVSSSLYVAGGGCHDRLPCATHASTVATPQLHLVYLGMLPEWRPIEALLTALEMASISVQVDVYGYLYSGAKDKIMASPKLRRAIRLHRSVSYEASHWLAEESAGLLVAIGPRHVDNQPSKFFEYLGHRKPYLVLGPRGNPIEALIRDLGIGVYCDIGSTQSILAGILKFNNHYSSFIEAYDRNLELIENYSAPRVAGKWVECLEAMLRQDS
ncbi:hypothetical protein NZK32_12355 [Cyanobium sp. FGCU-52]|nr:hypothetical protein [Cyanobium sp. FGCU52]